MSHLGGKAHKCGACNKWFLDQDAAFQHMSAVHAQDGVVNWKIELSVGDRVTTRRAPELVMTVAGFSQNPDLVVVTSKQGTFFEDFDNLVSYQPQPATPGPI